MREFRTNRITVVKMCALRDTNLRQRHVFLTKALKIYKETLTNVVSVISPLFQIC